MFEEDKVYCEDKRQFGFDSVFHYINVCMAKHSTLFTFGGMQS